MLGRTLALVTLAALLIPRTAPACSCIEFTLEETIQQADVIFRGTPVTGRTIESEPPLTLVEFTVVEAWKGLQYNTITLSTSTGWVDCGLGTDLGTDEVVVFANGEDSLVGPPYAGISWCSRPQPVSIAPRVRAVLGPGKRDLPQRPGPDQPTP